MTMWRLNGGISHPQNVLTLTNKYRGNWKPSNCKVSKSKLSAHRQSSATRKKKENLFKKDKQ